MYTTLRISEGPQFSFRTMFNKALMHAVLGDKELDELLQKPSSIPEKWKGLNIYFVGSIKFDEEGERYVRYISWNGGQWLEDREYLWNEKTLDHPKTPTIDDLRLTTRDVVAVVEMEHIIRIMM